MTCNKAQKLILLLQTGEGSWLDRCLVRRHTARCAECRAFAVVSRETTTRVRMRPFTAPMDQIDTQPILDAAHRQHAKKGL
jgi:hypothetical protein